MRVVSLGCVIWTLHLSGMGSARGWVAHFGQAAAGMSADGTAGFAVLTGLLLSCMEWDGLCMCAIRITKYQFGCIPLFRSLLTQHSWRCLLSWTMTSQSELLHDCTNCNED